MDPISIGLAIFGAGSSLFGKSQEIKYQQEQMKQYWASAISKYNAIEDANNIANFFDNKMIQSTLDEIKRVGASYTREISQEEQKALGQIRAAQEGITGGVSKQKQEVALKIKAMKMKNDAKSKAQSMIGQAIEAKDKAQNQRNQQTIQAYSEMLGALATTSPAMDKGMVGSQMFTSMLQGAQQGYSMGLTIGQYMQPAAQSENRVMGNTIDTSKYADVPLFNII